METFTTAVVATATSASAAADGTLQDDDEFSEKECVVVFDEEVSKDGGRIAAEDLQPTRVYKEYTGMCCTTD